MVYYTAWHIQWKEAEQLLSPSSAIFEVLIFEVQDGNWIYLSKVWEATKLVLLKYWPTMQELSLSRQNPALDLRLIGTVDLSCGLDGQSFVTRPA